MRRNRKSQLDLLTVVALVVVASLVMVPVSQQVQRVATVLPQAYWAVAKTSFEQRQVEFYGDHDRMGYGYVRRIMDGFPDPEAMPLVRNPDEVDNMLGVLLPGFHRNREDRVLIGVGVAESDTREMHIARARREVADEHGERTTTTWQFETGQGFELMTGVVLKFSSYPIPGLMRLKLTLIGSPMNRTGVIGQWEVETAGGQPGDITFRLPEPLPRFSLGRGATPFILRVEGGTVSPPAPSLVGFEVLGVKLSTKGYVVVNRELDCFTAVRVDLVAAIERTSRHPWSPWLEKIRNVRLD